MTIIGGLDIHRAQLTYDYPRCQHWRGFDGRIAPADRELLRAWLARFADPGEVRFALEGRTGWRYVVEELLSAGVEAHLAEPGVLVTADPDAAVESPEVFAQPWPRDDWPDVPTTIIASRDDRLFPLALQRQVARDRLGLAVQTLPGGHLVALSQPAALVDHIALP